MSSWYSRILTNTTSQISNLQSRLLQSENDGDTEDDTHVCRVLRGYYTEKGRPFPGWLPPDPKAPPPVTPVYAQPAQQVGSRYGGLQQPQQPGPATGLSSLWDNNAAAAQPRQDAMSLRQGRGAPPPMRGGEQPARLSPFARAGDSGREEVQARPLPSQRAGSYQQSAAYGRDATSTPPGSSAGGSAQDRLKQRLWGGSRTASPSSGAGGQGPFQPPAGRGGGGGGGGSNADYEDRFAPGGMYDGGNGGGGGGGGRPFIASNSPWSNNEPDYGGGGGGGGGGRTGLPNGPRRQGLPSGPRMR